MTTQEKKSQIKDWIDQLADMFGVEISDVRFEYTPDLGEATGTSHGQYDPTTRSITIYNTAYSSDDLEDVLDTLCHEAAEAYVDQYGYEDLIDREKHINDENDVIKKLAKDMSNYIMDHFYTPDSSYSDDWDSLDDYAGAAADDFADD